LIGRDPEGITLRELRIRADAVNRVWRERLVALVGLAFGSVKDVSRFIETGEVDGGSRGQSVPLTPEVSRHMKAIEKAGRFVMPDEVERILADGSPTATGNAKK
jgi:hypothetical protein